MNIWGLLFITVFLLWLFIEYLRYVKNRLLEIIKECEELKKAQKELEHEAITILKKAYEDQWDEEFEDEMTVSDKDEGIAEVRFKKGRGELMLNLVKKYFGIKYDCIKDLKDYKKVKIKARKGKIVIEKIEDKENKNEC